MLAGNGCIAPTKVAATSTTVAAALSAAVHMQPPNDQQLTLPHSPHLPPSAIVTESGRCSQWQPNPVEAEGRVPTGGQWLPIPLKQEEGLHWQRPEATYPRQSRRNGSTDSCPSPPEQEEGLHRQLPVPAGAGGKAPPATACPCRSRRKGSTGSCPSLLEQEEGLHRQLPVPAGAGGKAPPATARPCRSRRKGSTSSCPSPLEQEEGLHRQLPVPAGAGGRAPPAAAHPRRSRRKGSTGSCPSPPEQEEGLHRQLPVPARAGGRAPPAARGCLSPLKQVEGLNLQRQEAAHPWLRPEAAHPRKNRRKGFTGGGQERLPIPAEVGGRARLVEGEAANSRRSRRKGSIVGSQGLDRQRPGEAAHPSRSRGRGSTGGGQERLPVPVEARRRGSTGGGQERLPVPAEAGGGARPEVARRGCPSPSKQVEGLNMQSRLPIPGRGQRLPSPQKTGETAPLA
ncbi:sterile alpha motif domain-containing protein 1-like [Macrobrachium nipponense]|uniref:sterile alpha motif domain-containing protein 1-like n=1 Tax=Macrobrachium nipponense TaxID=159736 RepID=UPI0030C81AF9